jgi:hypothetical protein
MSFGQAVMPELQHGEYRKLRLSCARLVASGAESQR